MRLILLGFGRMGRLIKCTAVERGHEVITVDPLVQAANYKFLAEVPEKENLVAIDFSHPDSVLNNIREAAAARLNLVIGTTGWSAHINEVQALVASSGIGFLHAANFSLGVYLFSSIVRQAARLFSRFESYDAAGVEWHHAAKADSPSGTALSLAKIIQEEMPVKDKLVVERLDRQPSANEFHFASVRCGAIPGTHEIIFDSPADTISLRHTARSREGFALGAVLGAEWLENRRGFFTIDDMLKDLAAD